MICLAELYPTYEVSTKPTTFPVSVDEAKEIIRYTDNDQNDVIAGLIAAATEKLEHDTEQAFITQTRKLYFDDFPDVLRINFMPASAVSSITYVDEDGATQTLSSSTYQSDLKRVPGHIRLAADQTWPTVSTDKINAVTVTLTCGYGDSLSVPAMAKEAIKFLVDKMWKKCEGDVEGSPYYAMMVNALRWRPIL